MLTRYAVEGLLYRLSQTKHAIEFVLEGAILLRPRTEQLHGPTSDVDLLGSGDPSVERRGHARLAKPTTLRFWEVQGSSLLARSW